MSENLKAPPAPLQLKQVEEERNWWEQASMLEPRLLPSRAPAVSSVQHGAILNQVRLLERPGLHPLVLTETPARISSAESDVFGSPPAAAPSSPSRQISSCRSSRTFSVLAERLIRRLSTLEEVVEAWGTIQPGKSLWLLRLIIRHGALSLGPVRLHKENIWERKLSIFAL